MNKHIRANLWLLALTVLICCVLYPALLWAIGQTVFPDKANGSLVFDKDGAAIGSRLIAQPFLADEYFHPRPSAVSYNGAASGASNWGANNPALRKRVEGVLGPLLKYKDGRPVGPDIATWVKAELQRDPAVLTTWLGDDSGLIDHWAAAEPAVGDFLTKWQAEHVEAIAKWKESNTAAEIAPKDVAALFFQSYLSGETKAWPETSGQDLQVAFFKVWWKAHADADVQPVPADLVMASGSGLDPHITLDNALYQLDRVAAAWATKTKQEQSQVRQQIEKLLQEKSAAPLGGLVGVKLLNVFEINLALHDRWEGA